MLEPLPFNRKIMSNTPIPLDGDLWRYARSDKAPWIALFLEWFGGTSDTITTNKRPSSALAAIYETWWRPTDYRSSINIL